MDEVTRKNLLTTNSYWYETSVVCFQTTPQHTRCNWVAPPVQTGEADTSQPFLNKAIINILKEEYFDGRKSLYKLYPQEFKQSLATEDGGRGLEIPPRLVALVTTFVWFAPSPSCSMANDLVDIFCPFFRKQVSPGLEIWKLWPGIQQPPCWTEETGRWQPSVLPFHLEHLIYQVHVCLITCILGSTSNHLHPPCFSENNEQTLAQPVAASKNDYRGLNPENFLAWTSKSKLSYISFTSCHPYSRANEKKVN